MATKPTAKELSTTNTIMVTILISVVVVLAGVFVAKHLAGQLSLNQKISSKKSAAAAQLAVNLELAPQLVKTYNAQNLLIQHEITDALPTTPDIPGFIATMEHITGTSGVTLQSLAPQTTSAAATVPTTTATGPIPVSFTATVTGSYASLLHFLSNLQLSVRPVQLTSLAVQGTTSSITATLSLTTDYELAPSLLLGTETVK